MTQLSLERLHKCVIRKYFVLKAALTLTRICEAFDLQWYASVWLGDIRNVRMHSDEQTIIDRWKC